MRVLLESLDGAEGWVPQETDVDAIDSLWAFMGERAVICASDQELSEAVTIIQHSIPGQEARRLALDVLARTPIATRAVPSLPMLVGLTRSPVSDTRPLQVTFDAVARSGAVRLLLEKMRAGGILNDPRDGVFARIVKPLAVTASSVVIFDKYAADDLISTGKDGGTGFLLKALDHSGVPRVEMVSRVCARATDPNVVVDAANRLLRNGSNTVIEVWLAAQSQAEGRMHDRHFRFLYGPDRESTAVAVGKGTQIFAKPLLDDYFSITLDSPKVARKRETEVKEWQGTRRSDPVHR